MASVATSSNSSPSPASVGWQTVRCYLPLAHPILLTPSPHPSPPLRPTFSLSLVPSSLPPTPPLTCPADIWLQGIAVVLGQVQQELDPTRIEFATLALYVGLIIGASTWGVLADVIGRKLSFNVSVWLLSCSVSYIASGAVVSRTRPLAWPRSSALATSAIVRTTAPIAHTTY